MTRTAIFAATAWEFGAVRAAFPSGRRHTVNGIRVFAATVGEREYWLVRTGMGFEKAGRVAHNVLHQRPFGLVVSTGFACALADAEIGDLLVGYEVMLVEANGTGASPPIDVPGPGRDEWLEVVSDLKREKHVGGFMSVDHIVWQASEKARYARMTGAIGLDMESAALAREAKHAQVPFVILRTASDLLDEDLPLDFNLFLRPTDWYKGIRSVLAAPSSLVGLGRLRRQSRSAAEKLTEFFQHSASAMAFVKAESASGKNA